MTALQGIICHKTVSVKINANTNVWSWMSREVHSVIKTLLNMLRRIRRQKWFILQHAKYYEYNLETLGKCNVLRQIEAIYL